MVWTPNFGNAPITFFARNILNYIGANQDDAIEFYNTYWKPVIDHTLVRINEASMHVGNPVDLHARALYAIPTESITPFDCYYTSDLNIAIAYTTGNVAFEGNSDAAHAQQYAATEISGLYNLFLKDLIYKMDQDDLNAGFPDIPTSKPPGVALEIREARAKDAGVLRAFPEMGEELLIVVTLKVEANPIYPQ